MHHSNPQVRCGGGGGRRSEAVRAHVNGVRDEDLDLSCGARPFLRPHLLCGGSVKHFRSQPTGWLLLAALLGGCADALPTAPELAPAPTATTFVDGGGLPIA